MKKYLGLVGLGCGALLLAGCGGKSHTLTCTMKDDTQKQTVEIQFNSDETKAEKISMELVMTFDDSVTSEQLVQSQEALKEGCESAGYTNCKAKVSGHELTYSFDGTPETVGFEANGKLEDVKKDAEADGYTCK